MARIIVYCRIISRPDPESKLKENTKKFKSREEDLCTEMNLSEWKSDGNATLTIRFYSLN
jgi:hypothetical protein